MLFNLNYKGLLKGSPFFHLQLVSSYPEWYEAYKLLFRLPSDFMKTFIKIVDSFVQIGYSRRDMMNMPFWEMQEIIRIRNEKNEEDGGYILKI